MKHFNKKLIVFLLLVLSLHTNGCKQVNCSEGYEAVDCECICPPGEKFESGGICKALETNEYYGYSEDCECRDSAFFIVGEKKLNTTSNLYQVQVTKTMGVKGAPYAYGLDFNCVSSTLGDMLEGTTGRSPGCPVRSFMSLTTYQAWYLPNDTIKFLEINRVGDFTPIYDTCVWYLHK